MPEKFATLADAFNAYSRPTGNGHREWTLATQAGTVGRVGHGGRRYTSKQAAYILAHGVEPTGRAGATCGVAWCCEPAHTGIIAGPAVVEPPVVDPGPAINPDPRWHRRAACLGLPLEMFYPGKGQAGDEDTAIAAAVCRRCPVLAECLDAALIEEAGIGADSLYGVRAGLTPTERVRVRGMRNREKRKQEPPPAAPAPHPPKKAQEPAKCGTRRGYRKHRRNDEQACDPCRWANAAADRRLRTTGSTKKLAPA